MILFAYMDMWFQKSVSLVTWYNLYKIWIVLILSRLDKAWWKECLALLKHIIVYLNSLVQSQYPQAATATMNLPSSGNGSLTDPSSHASSSGLPRPTFQGSLPQYQPDASLESWGPSHLLPTTNGSGLAMPMYWQGYYGPSNGVQAPQQALLRPPPGLSMPPSMMQSVQYPAMNASNTSASPLSESPPLLPPFSTSTLNLPTSTLPSSRSSAMVSDSTNLTRVSTQTLPSNLPLASPLTTAVDKIAIASPGSYLPKTVPDPIMPFKRMSEPPSSIMRTSSSVLNEGKTPLVTPGQLLQPGPPIIPSLQSSQIAQKDVEVVQVSSPELSAPPPTTAAAEVQKPILPLPSQPEHKVCKFLESSIILDLRKFEVGLFILIFPGS